MTLWGWLLKHLLTIQAFTVVKFRIKGFIPVETLIANNKISRKKALTLAGK
jgi:hypothetical protein